MMDPAQLVPDLYYALGIIVTLIGGAWKLRNHIDKKFETVQKNHEERTAAFDNYKTLTDTKFATASQRHAELSERITATKLETFKELGGYVTRAEFERRMDRLEDLNATTNEKLDRVLARLPAQR